MSFDVNRPEYNENNVFLGTVWLLELLGQVPVEVSEFVPDANTYRGDYFYDAKNNQLLRKAIVKDKYGMLAVWKVAGGY